MSRSWFKPVEHADVRDDETYFIAIRPETEMADYRFHATNSRGKLCAVTKPGMANRFHGSQKMRDALAANPKLVAVEVPADADKRWSNKPYRNYRK